MPLRSELQRLQRTQNQVTQDSENTPRATNSSLTMSTPQKRQNKPTLSPQSIVGTKKPKIRDGGGMIRSSEQSKPTIRKTTQRLSPERIKLVLPPDTMNEAGKRKKSHLLNADMVSQILPGKIKQLLGVSEAKKSLPCNHSGTSSRSRERVRTKVSSQQAQHNILPSGGERKRAARAEVSSTSPDRNRSIRANIRMNK